MVRRDQSSASADAVQGNEVAPFSQSSSSTSGSSGVTTSVDSGENSTPSRQSSGSNSAETSSNGTRGNISQQYPQLNAPSASQPRNSASAYNQEGSLYSLESRQSRSANPPGTEVQGSSEPRRSSPQIQVPLSAQDDLRRSFRLNRSVPDLLRQNRMTRYRDAIVDQLASFRLRMQQNRMTSVERALSIENRIAGLASPVVNARSEFPLRRPSIGQNRHSPYTPRSSGGHVSDRDAYNGWTASRRGGISDRTLNVPSLDPSWSVRDHAAPSVGIRSVSRNSSDSLTTSNSSAENETEPSVSNAAREPGFAANSAESQDSILIHRGIRFQLSPRSQRNLSAFLRSRLDTRGRGSRR